MPKIISEEVQKVIGSLEIDGDKAYIREGQLDRKVYVAFNDAMESLGGKWDKKAKAHIFAGDPTEAIDELMLVGSYSSRKSDQQEYGFFETPPELADEVVKLVGVKNGMNVLEPSAGTGRLVEAVLRVAPQILIDCIELQEKNIDALRAKGYGWRRQDFLTVTPNPEYDRVVMNPPFSRQQDIEHVLHATKFLKPKGKLVAIMSASVAFRENRKTNEFWAAMEYLGKVSTKRNPDGAFKLSGTNVNTVTVFLEKTN